ncbi:MAG: tyrosine--tRNA ligase [Nanoarchaeota archaeon]|nr:tyrosine--tRNA ligase [Nanoarchaeota archaeon]
MDKLELIKRNTEEIINEKEISDLLKKKKPITYCGYETSGEITLGHMVTITKLQDLQKAGFHVKVLFADWHTYLNQKGDWDFIHKQVDIWKKGFKAAGLTKAEFILGSTFQRKPEYIDDVLILATKTTLNRGLRSMQQIARDIEHAKISQVIYPLMQITDIKHLKIDLVHSGLEQRKIHALGIEIFKLINYKTPVFVHTSLISSLKGFGKMSSSEPNSLISIRDSDENIKNKINKAHCPEGEIKDNPILQISQLIIFPRINEFKIERDKKFGGDLSFNNYKDLEKSFTKKELHPLDLKNSVSKYLIEIISPIRKQFKS